MGQEMGTRGDPRLGRAPRIAVFVVLYMTIFAVQTWVTREYFTRHNPGGNDFYPRWAGGCALLRSGLDPYSAEATIMIQEGIHGRPARPGEDQAAFAYPLYVLAVTWPTCLSNDFAIVQAAWMTLLIHVTVLGTAIARDTAGWKPSKWVWFFALPWAVLFYPNARAILLGQLSLFVFLFLMLMLFAIVRGMDFVAGALLAASTIKPQMVIMIVPWILWWSVWRKRYRIPLGFCAALLALAGSAAMLQPDWIAGFFRQLGQYPSYTEFGSAIWIMTTYYLQTPRLVEIVLTILVSGGLLYAAWHWRQAEVGKMLWVSSLMLVGTHMIAPRTATTHFATYLLALFMILELWRQRSGRIGEAYGVLLLLILLVGTWTLFILTVEGIQESAINYLPVPFAMLLALLALRSRLIAAWRRL